MPVEKRFRSSGPGCATKHHIVFCALVLRTRRVLQNAEGAHPSFCHACGEQVCQHHWGQGVGQQQLLPQLKVRCNAQFTSSSVSSGLSMHSIVFIKFAAMHNQPHQGLAQQRQCSSLYSCLSSVCMSIQAQPSNAIKFICAKAIHSQFKWLSQVPGVH